MDIRCIYMYIYIIMNGVIKLEKYHDKIYILYIYIYEIIK